MGTGRMRMVVLLFSLFSSFSFLACGDSQNADVSKKSASELDLTKAEVDLLTQAAYQKARALGYDVRGKDFVLSKEGEAYKGSFSPREKGALGGGLNIYLDKRGNVIRFLFEP